MSDRRAGGLRRTKRLAATSTKSSYDEDVILWAEEQARLLRAGRFAELDIAHVADEIEDVGKSEKRELASRMAVLLAHLLKWRFQPARRTGGWRATIVDQRKRIALALKAGRHVARRASAGAQGDRARRIAGGVPVVDGAGGGF